MGKLATEFKIGDKVICVDASGWLSARENLVEGKTYIVYETKTGAIQVTSGKPNCPLTQYKFDR